MCAKHKHEAAALDRFLTKACGPCMVEKVFANGITNTDRFRYRITNGKRKLIKKHVDALKQW